MRRDIFFNFEPWYVCHKYSFALRSCVWGIQSVLLSTSQLPTRIWFWFLHAPVVCQALFTLFKHWVVLLVYPPAKSLPSGYVLRKSLWFWETVEYNWNWSFSLIRIFGVTLDWWRSVSVGFRLLKLINNS